jgi:hypothetical protein
MYVSRLSSRREETGSLDTDPLPLSGILISSTLGGEILRALIANAPKGVSNHEEYRLLDDGNSK